MWDIDTGESLPNPRNRAPAPRPPEPSAVSNGGRAILMGASMSALRTTAFEVASPTICVVSLYGEHDVSTERAVARTMALAEAYPYVLVDITKCTFMDSLIVGALAKGAGQARARGGRLVLAAAPGRDHVRRTLEILHIDDLIVVHASRAAAIVSLDQVAEARHVGERRREEARGSGWVANAQAVRQQDDPDLPDA
jgi:anti-anti-sigma factor